MPKPRVVAPAWTSDPPSEDGWYWSICSYYPAMPAYVVVRAQQIVEVHRASGSVSFWTAHDMRQFHARWIRIPNPPPADVLP